MNNYIGIDISINSTAIYIESNLGNKIISFTNKKDNNIYIKELDRYGVDFVFLNRDKSDDYSENEVLKLKHFNEVSETILEKCKIYIDSSEMTFCQIEGYSFSKNTSSILDIVSLSTLIKSKLIVGIDKIDMTIISPNSLKLEACKICYEPINVGVRKPKFVFRNNQGISGGSFKKPDMYKAMVEGNIESPIIEMLKEYYYLIERNKIPNPIEDIIDAIFACKIKINETSK